MPQLAGARRAARLRAGGLPPGRADAPGEDAIRIQGTREPSITPCDAEQSRLVRRAADGSMPPRGSVVSSSVPSSPLSSGDHEQLRGFIDSMCDGFRSPKSDPERAAVESLLGERCGSCHGREAQRLGTIAADFAQVESATALLEAGWFLPCGSESSLLMNRLRDGSMPPAESGHLTRDELDAVARFIDRPCARP